MIALLASAWAECPPVAPLLDSLQRDLEDVRTTAAREELREARSALACSPVLSPQQAARLHAYTGVLATLEGEADRALASLSSARQLAPGLDLSAFGPSLESAFRAAPAAPEVPFALEPPLGPARSAWIDGFPAGDTVQPGQHTIQITDPIEGTLFGTLFIAETGTPTVVPTGLPPHRPAPVPRPVEPPPPPRPASVVVAVGRPSLDPDATAPTASPSPQEPETERSPVLPVIGAVVTAVGVGTLAYSFERGAALKTAPDAATLDRRWTTHRITRVTGLGASVIGAGLLISGAF